MTARAAHSHLTRPAHTAFWLLLIASLGVGGEPVGAKHQLERPVQPVTVSPLPLDGDETAGTPVRSMWPLTSGSVRVGSRGPAADARHRSAGGATLPEDPPTAGALHATLAGFVHEDELPGRERPWRRAGIRGPPA